MRTRNPLPSRDDLLDLFAYCPETGELTRRSSGRSPSSTGKYLFVTVLGKCSLAHRVIWKMMTGDEPEIIDHINCDGRDNRWLNLRPASHRQNLRNRGAPVNNTSGIKGVSFDRATGLWRAQITVDYRNLNLGRYPTIEEAAEARRIASDKLHGDFSRAA